MLVVDACDDRVREAIGAVLSNRSALQKSNEYRDE